MPSTLAIVASSYSFLRLLFDDPRNGPSTGERRPRDASLPLPIAHNFPRLLFESLALKSSSTNSRARFRSGPGLRPRRILITVEPETRPGEYREGAGAASLHLLEKPCAREGKFIEQRGIFHDQIPNWPSFQNHPCIRSDWTCLAPIAPCVTYNLCLLAFIISTLAPLSSLLRASTLLFPSFISIRSSVRQPHTRAFCLCSPAAPRRVSPLFSGEHQ